MASCQRGCVQAATLLLVSLLRAGGQSGEQPSPSEPLGSLPGEEPDSGWIGPGASTGGEGPCPNHFGITNITPTSEGSQFLAHERAAILASPQGLHRVLWSEVREWKRPAALAGLASGEAPGWEARPPQEVTWPRCERRSVGGRLPPAPSLPGCGVALWGDTLRPGQPEAVAWCPGGGLLVWKLISHLRLLAL